MDKIELTDIKPIKAQNQTRWQAKAKLPGYPRGKSIAIFDLGGQLIAVPSLCPHEGANLIQATLIDNEILECPNHQNRYNIFTDLTPYRIEMEDGKMYLIIGETPVSVVDAKKTSEHEHHISNEETIDPLSVQEYEKKIRSLTNEVEELRSVKSAQELQVIEGYKQIEKMLTELEDQKSTLTIQNEIIVRSNEFINRVTDTMEEILIVVGVDGTIRQVNKKMPALLGYRMDEILGENPDRFFTKSNLEEIKKNYIPEGRKYTSIIFYTISNNTQVDLIAGLLNSKGESIIHLIRGSLLINTFGKKDGMVLVCTNIQELQRIQAELVNTLEKVDKLRKESDRLLLNILPQNVAQELKSSGSVKPVQYDFVTVLFTDFKGFTNIAEIMKPEELISELDHCFSKFDQIIDKFHVEKLKTIGDAYMCAGGIPEKNHSNPFDVILAGLNIREIMEEIKRERISQNKSFFELRIGVHTGPLVAGVVGNKKFAYDIWGDTVNMASRMESSGTPGMVNISRATYEIIKEYFICESRGKIMAKRKGDVEMYYVNRIKPEYSEDENGIAPNHKFLEYINSLRNE